MQARTANAVRDENYWNFATVRYRPDLKTVMGTNATRAPGCKETGSNGDGMNRPLQSAHPGGILAGMVDGSVQFVSGTTGLEVLLRLAIRMDGQTVKLQ